MGQRDPGAFDGDDFGAGADFNAGDFDMDERAEPPDFGPGDSPEVAAVRAVNDAFFDAWSARDADAMERLWAQRQPVTCIHPNWQPLTNRDQVMDSWRAIMRNPQQPRIVGGQAIVRAIIGEVAYVLYRQFVGGTPLIITNVFVHEDGEWRVLVHHAGRVALRR